MRVPSAWTCAIRSASAVGSIRKKTGASGAIVPACVPEGAVSGMASARSTPGRSRGASGLRAARTTSDVGDGAGGAPGGAWRDEGFISWRPRVDGKRMCSGSCFRPFDRRIGTHRCGSAAIGSTGRDVHHLEPLQDGAGCGSTGDHRARRASTALNFGSVASGASQLGEERALACLEPGLWRTPRPVRRGTDPPDFGSPGSPPPSPRFRPRSDRFPHRDADRTTIRQDGYRRRLVRECGTPCRPSTNRTARSAWSRWGSPRSWPRPDPRSRCSTSRRGAEQRRDHGQRSSAQRLQRRDLLLVRPQRALGNAPLPPPPRPRMTGTAPRSLRDAEDPDELVHRQRRRVRQVGLLEPPWRIARRPSPLSATSSAAAVAAEIDLGRTTWRCPGRVSGTCSRLAAAEIDLDGPGRAPEPEP